MKTNALSTMAALIIMCASAQAAPVAVSGKWVAQVPNPNGQMRVDVVFTFSLSGSKLTGTASANGSAYDLVDTKIDGATIAFAVDGESARYTGTLVGDEMKMQVTYKSGENGTRRWSFVAKRAAPDAPVEQASIDGEWTGEVPRGGSRFIAAEFQFHVDGSTLTGVVHALDDEFPLTNATIAGSRMAFNIGETKGDFTGELTGDTIRMKVKYSGGENGRQTLDFVLTRVKR